MSEWFCDQCGARYPEDGECTNQHPAEPLKPVTATAAAPVPSTPAPAAPAPDPTIAAPTEPAAESQQAKTDTGLKAAVDDLKAAWGELGDKLQQLRDRVNGTP